jgi:hypothetical protein
MLMLVKCGMSHTGRWLHSVGYIQYVVQYVHSTLAGIPSPRKCFLLKLPFPWVLRDNFVAFTFLFPSFLS